MKILALDLSRKATGWTVDGGEGRPRHGTFRGAAATVGIGRAGVAFNQWLSDMIDVTGPEAIAIEAPAVAGHGIVMGEDEAMLLIGLAFVCATVAELNGLRFMRAHVQTVRKCFVGQGRPKDAKAAVLARCKQIGWTVSNFDEADSAALWFWAKANHDRSFRIETGRPLFAGGSAA